LQQPELLGDAQLSHLPRRLMSWTIQRLDPMTYGVVGDE
jgi:hypothetical protein